MLKLPFKQGSWWITVVRQEWVGERPGVQQEQHGAERWEMLGYAMLLILVAPRLSEGCCQPGYSHFILMNFSSSPKLLQYNPKAHRLGLGQGEEVELWFVAVFCLLFQFNLQACLFLAVPLRFSRQSQGFNVICTSMSDWFSDLFRVLQFGINVAFLFQWVAVEAKRNVYLLGSLYRYVFKEWEDKPKQANPLFIYLLMLSSVLFLLRLLAGEKDKSKDLLWAKSTFSFSLLYFLCVVLLLVSLLSY